jgi:hypothetical protein
MGPQYVAGSALVHHLMTASVWFLVGSHVRKSFWLKG